MSADDIEIIDLFCLVLLLWNFFSLLFVVRIYLDVSNDWHTAVAYQGRFHSADFELLNLPKCFMPSLDFIDGHVKPVVGRKINRMKAGITECDLVLAVSPRYVKELTSGPAKGVELDSILRTKPLETGIINGMNVHDWNPATNKCISSNTMLQQQVTEARLSIKKCYKLKV